MASVKETKQRMSNIRSTKQIIKALDMISSVKLQKARARLDGVRPLYRDLKRVAEGLKYCEEAGEHVFTEKREVKYSAYIVLTSDKGMCGSYNVKVAEAALAHMNAGKNEKILAVGATGSEYFSRHGKNILHRFTHISEANMYGDAGRLSEHITRLYVSGEVDEVFIAYTCFDSMLSYLPRVEQVLPLPNEPDGTGKTGRLCYEPDVHSFIDHLVPLYLHTCFFAAASESDTCEHAARMVNMQSADKNAEEVLSDLNRVYNRKRQAAITQELTEIIGGANLLT